MLLTPRGKPNFRLPPAIGGGGGVGQPSAADEHRCRTLEEDFEFFLNAIRKRPSPRTQDLAVLSKTRVAVQGLPAIQSTIRYRNSFGEAWFDEEILIHTRDDGINYHLELHCSPDDLAVLLPLFDEVVATYRILGPPR